MQKIGIYVLVIQMMTGTWAAPFAYLDYELRKDYISRYLCINKSKPKLNCNGKCFLAKKLKKASKDQKKDQKTSSKQLFTFYQESVSEVDFDAMIYWKEDLNIRFVCPFSTKLFSFNIFHPPRA